MAPPKPKAAPPIATFDRKKARKIRSGQVDIEARIDLHGMRQDEAHVALVRFLHRCQGKGQRWVLVITGKGKLADRDDDAPFDMTRQRERGVLKRNVPRWLDEPDLQAAGCQLHDGRHSAWRRRRAVRAFAQRLTVSGTPPATWRVLFRGHRANSCR